MGVRSVPLRFAAMAALAVAAAALAGCASAAPKTAEGGAAVSEFRNGFLVFSHPAAWKPFVFKVTGTLHFHPMLYLSSQPAHQPCRKHASETVCGWPIGRLRPGGTLIVWENRGAPGASLASFPGTVVRIGGRRAKQAVSRPGDCGAIGADETIEAAIQRPMPDNWTAFTACLRGPGLADAERQIDALLASTQFLAP